MTYPQSARKIILNAKIIDVESGRNIKADKVEAAGIGEMTNAVELLAFKLAGLTYTSGGDVRVATTFGEVLIETTPPGADIYINGAKKGISPDLINRIPLGTITVEARKGNLYGSRTLTVSEDTAQIKLTLEEQFGKLFIKSSVADVDVYLDGRKLGPLGSGFFDGLPVGGHLLELKGPSTYWKEDVDIEAGVSTKIEAYPRGFGYMDYELPLSAAAYIKGTDFSRTLTGAGSVKLDEGLYKISVNGSIYNPIEKKISITGGDRLTFSPQLIFTDAHIKKLTEERQEAEYSSFDTGLNSLENKFANDYRYTDKDLSDLKKIENDIGAAEFSFDDIDNRFTELNTRAVDTKKKQDELDELQCRKIELELQFSAIEESQKKHSIGGWASLGVGGASAILSGTSFLLSWMKYQDYLSAGESEWQDLKDQYKMWDLIGYISAGVAVVGGGTGAVLWLTSPDTKENVSLSAELAIVNSEIERLNKAIR